MAPLSNQQFTAYVGIDWADTKHDICLQAAGDIRREFDCMYALKNLGRARAYCSSRGSDALFDEVRQKGNLIAARNAVGQIVPERDAQLATGLLQTGEGIATLPT